MGLRAAFLATRCFIFFPCLDVLGASGPCLCSSETTEDWLAAPALCGSRRMCEESITDPQGGCCFEADLFVSFPSATRDPSRAETWVSTPWTKLSLIPRSVPYRRQRRLLIFLPLRHRRPIAVFSKFFIGRNTFFFPVAWSYTAAISFKFLFPVWSPQRRGPRGPRIRHGRSSSCSWSTQHCRRTLHPCLFFHFSWLRHLAICLVAQRSQGCRYCVDLFSFSRKRISHCSWRTNLVILPVYQSKFSRLTCWLCARATQFIIHPTCSNEIFSSDLRGHSFFQARYLISPKIISSKRLKRLAASDVDSWAAFEIWTSKAITCFKRISWKIESVCNMPRNFEQPLYFSSTFEPSSMMILVHLSQKLQKHRFFTISNNIRCCFLYHFLSSFTSYVKKTMIS